MFKKFVTSCLTLCFLFSCIAPCAQAEEGIRIPTPESIVHPRGGVYSHIEVTEVEEPSYADEVTLAAKDSYDPAENEAELFAYLETACLNHETTIALDQFKTFTIHKDVFVNVYYRFVMTHPLLLLRTGYNSSVGSSSGNMFSVSPIYLFETKAETETAGAALQQKADSYRQSAQRYTDPIEQLLDLHDAIIRDAAYDHDFQETSYHAYGLVKNGKVVCQGYSQMFYMVATALGFETNFILYDAPNPENNHMWNCVKVNGKWYLVDVTWDDPSFEDASLTVHEYFLISAAQLLTQDTSKGHGERVTDWSSYLQDASVPSCTDRQYETEYIFNVPFAVKLEHRSGKIGFELTLPTDPPEPAFFASKTLHSGNILLSEANNDHLFYYFIDTPPSHIDLYFVHKNARGLVGSVQEDSISNKNANTIYWLDVNTPPTAYPKLSAYFFEKDSVTPCGNRADIF